MVRLSELIRPGPVTTPEAIAPPLARVATPRPAPEAHRTASSVSLAAEGRHDSPFLSIPLVQECARCLEEARQQQPLTLGEIPLLMDGLVDQLSTDEAEWLWMSTMGRRPFSLAAHGLNVAVLSVRVGIELEMKRSALVDLGIAALLHDVGMVHAPRAFQTARQLNPQQVEEMREHPVWGERIAQRCPDLPPMARGIIAQEHEREDGSGYPRRLSGADIDEHAQLVGLLDVYEALTHDRPHRGRVVPAEAARVVTQDHRSAFRGHLLRAFLRAVPLFPVESWVRLSTGDLAQVIATSARQSLTPTVSVRFDRLRRPYPRAETVDLARHARLAIVEAVPPPQE